MTTSQPTSTREKNKPAHPPGGKIDIDELAKQWVELVLQDRLKAPVVFPKNSSYNKVIGQFDIGEL